MWINKEVDLPEALVSAHRARRLVIFAGAGISMGAPSNLPDFGRLADLISGGTLTRTPDEPLDLFLGKLQSKQVDVQARARTFIGDPASTVSPIHAALVDLFASADAVIGSMFMRVNSKCAHQVRPPLGHELGSGLQSGLAVSRRAQAAESTTR